MSKSKLSEKIILDTIKLFCKDSTISEIRLEDKIKLVYLHRETPVVEKYFSEDGEIIGKKVNL